MAAPGKTWPGNMFWAIGLTLCVLATARVVYLLLRHLISYFVASKLFPLDYKKFGQWAVVTGATDGIGKAYAFQFAKRGLNVVLISRSSEKLKATAEEIGSAHETVKIRTIVADFGHHDIYDGIREQLTGLDVGILVNNVGVGNDVPDFYHSVENGEEFMSKMITINCTSMHRMTWMVLPGMLAKKKGVVMNVSSGAGMSPMPFMSLYAGTKAFVRNFTESLHWEYVNDGIMFKCLVPYYVATNMSGIRKPSLMAPSATRYASSTLDVLGTTDVVTTGYWPHGIQNWVMSLVPTWMLAPLVLRTLKSAKLRILAKRKRQQ